MHENVAHDFHLEQLVCEPTRYGPTSANTLDLVFSSKPDLLYDVRVIPGVSDHEQVVAHINRLVSNATPPQRKVFDFNKGNSQDFCPDMKAFSVSFLETCPLRSVHENWQILSLVNKHYPEKLLKTQRKNPWLNRALRRSTRKKRRLFKVAKLRNTASAWAAYRQQRKMTTIAIKSARNSFVSGLLDENLKSQPKRFLKYIKSRQQDCVGIPALRSESGTLSDPKEKAETLNNYFKSVFKTDAPNDTLPTLAPKDIPAIGNICVTVNGIVKLLNLLKPNKACGPDKVSAGILKLAPEETAVILRGILGFR